MRGTISECLSSVQRCSMSPLLFLKAKNLSEPYSLGCNADRRAAFSLSLSFCPTTVTPLSWSGWEETVNALVVWKKKCVCQFKDVSCACQHERESDGTCATTWLLFTFCVKVSVRTECACVCSTDQTVKGKRGKYCLTEPWSRTKSHKSSSGSSIPEPCRDV